ncbi:MAG: hypothetical protein JNM99_07270 [Verrucomicrobiaceae bacterium]|nr:hypothetical protein [Verrucomicrobiaceae bacterium]
MTRPLTDALAAPPLSQEAGARPLMASSERPQPGDVAGWFAIQGDNPHTAREWAVAMRKPVEYSLEDLRRRPRRAAELLAPVMDAALVEHRRHRVARMEDHCWKWMAVLVNPRLWPLSLKALWQGEPVWDYMERTSEWFQVVEAVLVESGTNVLLGSADAPWRRSARRERPLSDFLTVPASESDADARAEAEAEDSNTSRVMVLVGVQCRLAVRVHGHPPAKLRPALQLLCQEADRMLEHAQLDTGNRASFIEHLLPRALMKHTPATSPWTLRTAIVLGSIAAFAILGLATYYAKQERTWQHAVRAFSEEPGFQIVGESTSWGKREIRGLRDPLARDPKVLLKQLDIDPEEVVLKFKAYVSAEEPFMKARKAAGPHPIMARSGKANEATRNADEESSTERVMEVLESTHLTFQAGSNELAGNSKEKLSFIAEQLQHLERVATANSGALTAEFIVRQSSTSTDDSLWQLRLSTVREKLVKAGVSPLTLRNPTSSPSPSVSSAHAAPDSLSFHLTFDSPSKTP